MIKKISSGFVAVIVFMVILSGLVYNAFRTMDMDFDFEDIK